MLAVYRALFVAQFQSTAQYRLQAVLWLLVTVVRPVVFLAAWSAVAESQGGSVGGYDASSFATYYISLTLVTQLTQAWNAWDFEQDVRQGKLSAKLLRPLHPIHYAVVENIVWKSFTIVAVVPVLALVAVTFHARFDVQPWQVGLFVISSLIAAALRFMFWWVVALLAFWTTRVQAAINLIDRVAFIFAGQIAPLPLLPGPLQTIAYILPFGYMMGVPAEILGGGATVQQTLLEMLGQVAWLAASIGLFLAVWRFGLRQYSAVGA
jgi:ABC-2 type transport system permease protein